MKRAFDSATCPLCQTYFDRLPVDGDEDGACTILPVTPCFECGALLCDGGCPKFSCDGCGHAFCSSHAIIVPDGTPEPLHCCATCAAECEPLPLPFPPARETRRPTLVAKEAA